MKKIIKYAVFLIVSFLIGFSVYMECNFYTVKMVKSKITQEKILKEYPEIVITDEDLALEDYILGLTEIQMMIEQSKEEKQPVRVMNDEAEKLLSGWIEDGWTFLNLDCEADFVYLLWIKDGDKNVSYNFSVEGDYPIQKTIGIYKCHFDGTTSVDIIYENINGVIKKNVFKRQWFYWVTALLENGYNENMFFGT